MALEHVIKKVRKKKNNKTQKQNTIVKNTKKQSLEESDKETRTKRQRVSLFFFCGISLLFFICFF